MGRGEAQGGAVFQGDDGLDGTFAKTFGSHQEAAFSILYGPGDDFRSRGAAFVNQDHQRNGFFQVRPVFIGIKARGFELYCGLRYKR